MDQIGRAWEQQESSRYEALVTDGIGQGSLPLDGNALRGTWRLSRGSPADIHASYIGNMTTTCLKTFDSERGPGSRLQIP